MPYSLTAIVIAYNECESAKLTIDTLRMFADIDDLNVVLVDNASTDGLREWASTQDDITYIYMDEGREKFGDLLNKVIETLEITTDMLIMEAHYGITSVTLSRLCRTLYENERTGIVVPIHNGLYQKQQLDSEILDFQSALEYALNIQSYDVDRVMGIEGGAFLISRGLYDELGGFEKRLWSSYHFFNDLSLSLMEKGKEISVCKGAIIWDLMPSFDGASDENRYYKVKKDHLIMEEKWGMHYFNLQYNWRIVKTVCDRAKPNMKVLEIGCDLGATLFEIKNHCPDADIYGCELNPNAVKIASYFMEAKVCNIEEEKVPFDVDGYDFIIFGDVLEHLRDPLKALQNTSKLLNKGGRIVASIPNLMNITVIEKLLGGDFTYTDVGLLDKTHIHFFTFNEIIKMFGETILDIEEIGNVEMQVTDEQKKLINTLLSLNENAREHMYTTYQYLVTAVKQ